MINMKDYMTDYYSLASRPQTEKIIRRGFAYEFRCE